MKTVIIGAGPAGLAAAETLSRANFDNEIFVIDKGKPHKERQHNVARDLGNGTGGAGLFSDGKFSFYPSGTGVFRLNDKEALQIGHEWICVELNKAGISSYPLNINENIRRSTNFFVKEYPSTYGNLVQRKKLIDNLVKNNKSNFVNNFEVVEILKENNQYKIKIKSTETSEITSLQADHIIIATGRLGNLDLSKLMPNINFETNKLRYEFGIRIETKANVGFLNRRNNPDVKAIWKTPFGEIRTFCTCRNGEIWDIPYGKISAISGRSDGPKTDYSNFGLLLRFNGESFDKGEELFQKILGSDLLKKGQVIWEPINSFMTGQNNFVQDEMFNNRPSYPSDKFVRGSIVNVIGMEGYKVFLYALNKLIEWSPDLKNESTRVLFPVIEGTGRYPKLTNDLQIEGENIWCCGDLAGSFRGIIPAFLSGFYTANQVIKLTKKYINNKLISFEDHKNTMAKKGVGVILCNDEGKILLGHRIGLHGYGTWSFPGGHVEINETTEECAIRETKEEAGIHLFLSDLVKGPETHDFFPESKKEYDTQFIIARCNSAPLLQEPDKFTEWNWFYWDQLPEPLFEPIKNLIRQGFGEKEIFDSISLNKRFYSLSR